MAHVYGNSDMQRTHLRKDIDYREKNCMEMHRNEKAYKRFKHMPDYGRKERNHGELR